MCPEVKQAQGYLKFYRLEQLCESDQSNRSPWNCTLLHVNECSHLPLGHCLVPGWPIPHWGVTLSSLVATIGVLLFVFSC